MELLAKTKEEFRNHLSEHLKRYRKMRHWDQHDLAAAVGLTAGGIRGYEQKTRFPKPEELQKLADVLKTTPSKLLEDPSLMATEQEITPEQALAVLSEAIKGKKDVLIPGELESLRKENERLKAKLAAIEEADRLIEDTEKELKKRGK